MQWRGTAPGTTGAAAAAGVEPVVSVMPVFSSRFPVRDLTCVCVCPGVSFLSFSLPPVTQKSLKKRNNTNHIREEKVLSFFSSSSCICILWICVSCRLPFPLPLLPSHVTRSQRQKVQSFSPFARLARVLKQLRFPSLPKKRTIFIFCYNFHVSMLLLWYNS